MPSWAGPRKVGSEAPGLSGGSLDISVASWVPPGHILGSHSTFLSSFSRAGTMSCLSCSPQDQGNPW